MIKISLIMMLMIIAAHSFSKYLSVEYAPWTILGTSESTNEPNEVLAWF